MENLDLIYNLARTLVWPFTIIILVLILRPAIAKLIPDLKRIKYKKLELEFENRVHSLAKQTAEIFTPEENLIFENGSGFKDLTKLSSRAAIHESWLSVQIPSRKNDMKYNNQKTINAERSKKPIKPAAAISLLEEFNKLGLQSQKIIDFTISLHTVQEYVCTGRRIKNRMAEI